MSDAIPEMTVGSIFRMGDQFHDSALLHFAVAERLFDDLVDQTSAAELAARRGWLPEKSEIVLNALTALGLLRKAGDRFQNTLPSDSFLRSTSREFVGPIIDHQRLQWSLWSMIGQSLVTQHSTVHQQENRLASDSKANAAFNQAMIRLAKDNIAQLLESGLFAGAGRVLDICGGHGAYLAEIAKQYPNVTGEVWDLATTREVAEQQFRSGALESRLSFREIDIRKTDWRTDEQCDLCMLNDCLHYFTYAEIQVIIEGVVSLLRPGGKLVILTMTLDPTGTAPPSAAGFSLHMMLNTRHGKLHPTDSIVELLRGAGLQTTATTIGALARYTMIVGEKNS